MKNIHRPLFLALSILFGAALYAENLTLYVKKDERFQLQIKNVDDWVNIEIDGHSIGKADNTKATTLPATFELSPLLAKKGAHSLRLSLYNITTPASGAWTIEATLTWLDRTPVKSVRIFDHGTSPGVSAVWTQTIDIVVEE